MRVCIRCGRSQATINFGAHLGRVCIECRGRKATGIGEKTETAGNTWDAPDEGRVPVSETRPTTPTFWRKPRPEMDAWWMRALCRYHPDPDLFFPCLITDGSRWRGSVETPETVAAKKVCADCSVRSECLEWILGYEQMAGVTGRWGIWGGTTPVERHRISRERAKGIQRLA